MALKIQSKLSSSNKTQKRVRTKFDDVKQLSITSLLDVLTIILVFLIKNVSTEAVKISAEKGIEFPSTITNDALMDKAGTTPVKLFLDKVIIGNESLEFGTPDELFSNNEKRQGIIDYFKLEVNDILTANQEPCLVVQADAFLPCDYVSEIVKIGTSAGYTTIYFATLENADWLKSYSMNSTP